MSGIRRRSWAEQAGRLSVLGILIGVLAFTAVAAPRVGDRVLEGYLTQTVSEMSAGARAVQGYTDATHYSVPLNPITAGGPQVPFTVGITHTWDAMPKTLAKAKALMPEALRRVTGQGYYAGIADPPAGIPGVGGAGIPVAGLVPDHPNGHEWLVVEGYPALKQDARLVSGTWPTAPRTAGGAIPIVITQESAKVLGWHVGQTQTLAIRTSVGGPQKLTLVGTIAPKQTASQYWQFRLMRPEVRVLPDLNGNLHYFGTVWTDPAAWPAVAPSLGAFDVTTWYPVVGDRMSLTQLQDLQDALTTYLVEKIPIDDGTQDGHVLQQSSALPQMLNLFDNTVQSTRTVFTVATVAALGLGMLVLLAVIALALGARRPVRELLRTRGASAATLARSAAGDAAVWSVPAAVIGAGAGILLVPSIGGMPVVGAREIITALTCAAVPVLLAAGAVLVESMPPGLSALLRQSRWVGELLVVLFAVAAVIVTLGGGSDAATAVAGLAVGLAASVVLLRVLPIVLRWATGLVRRGGAAVFLGLRDAAGAGWLVVASVTATATGVLTLLLGMSVARAQQESDTPGPKLLAPGSLAVVAAAVVLCVLFAATAFAVSAVAGRSPRRARAASLRRLGYSGGQRARVSLWGTIPLTAVAVAAGALVGAWSATPVLGAVAAASGQAIAIVVSPAAVVAVAAGILVLIVIIEAVALASDARVMTRTRRRTS